MNKKEILCLVISIVMLLSLMMPAGAFAEELDYEIIDEFYEEPYVEEYFSEDEFVEEYVPEEVFYEDEWTSYEDTLSYDDELIEEMNESEPDAGEPDESSFDSSEIIMSDTEVFNAGGSVTIETQPADWEGDETGRAEFTVTAAGGTEPYTYQWQYKTASGNWKDRSGATEKDFSILAKGREGMEFRCVVTDADGNIANSDSAKIIYAAPKLIIETQPADWEGEESGRAEFTVAAANGTEPYTYQWQYKTASGNWKDRADANAKDFSILAKGREGMEFRCVVTDADGNIAYSDSAKIIYVEVSEFTIGEFTYKILEDSTVEVKSYSGTSAEVTVEASVTYANVSYNVSAIGEGAFLGNKTLTTIHLPNAITTIKAQAFKGCTALSNMDCY